MKPRVIAPYKVLAVALATAACGKTPADEPQVQQASAEPRAQAATPPTPVPVSTVSDAKADPKLLELRAELDRETLVSVRGKEAHSRPLCDKDGYPLVGNVVRKGGDAPQPSQFCADVRAKKATPS